MSLRKLKRKKQQKSTTEKTVSPIMAAKVHEQLTLAGELHNTGALSEAETLYRNVLKLDPNNAHATNMLGFIAYQREDYKTAVNLMQKSVQMAPDCAGYYNNLGLVLNRLKKQEEAIACFKKAIAISPDCLPAIYKLGICYKHLGRFSDAKNQFLQALQIEPFNANAFLGLVSVKKYTTADTTDITIGKNILRQPHANENNIIRAHFGLGKIYDNCKIYEKAFHHYHLGNQLKSRLEPYDPQPKSNLIKKTITVFSQEVIRDKQIFTEENNPVFIVGMPRSGTTLVEAIIAGHPQVHGAGELTKIRQLTEKVSSLLHSSFEYPECMREIKEETTRALIKEYLTYLKQGAPAKTLLITDKMPYNFLRLGFIAILFPRARIIHCCRHPLDTCLSIYFQFFKSGHQYAYNLIEIAHYYKEYEKLMAHWRHELPLEMFEIQYEDLIANQEKKSRELINYLGLEWDPACLNHHKSKKIIQTSSSWQVRQPIYKGSVARWKNYEEFLGPLKDALGMTETTD